MDALPVKVIKPVLITWVLLSRHIPLQINATWFGTGIVTGVGFLLSLFFQTNWPLVPMLIYSAAFFFIGVPCVVLYLNKRIYAEISYTFYADRLAYTDGFWTIAHKVVMYHVITEIYMCQSILQRMCGLGSIYLSVPSGGGIVIHDIREPEKICQEIQGIISSIHT